MKFDSPHIKLNLRENLVDTCVLICRYSKKIEQAMSLGRVSFSRYSGGSRP
jgi:hypothetical protein